MNLTFPTVSSLPELGLRPPQGTAPSHGGPQNENGGFADMLRHLAADTANAVRQGEVAALAGINGSLPLQTVVEQVMAAERTLQTALAVRDKAVSSYLEISRMQI